MNINKEIIQVSLDDIIPNRFQPREQFDEQALNELAESIKQHGVINPIVVRKIGDKYEIVAGERRHKASILAGKTTIPAIVADLNDYESAEVALIENIQRKDLTPIEEAKTYQTILKMGNITQEQLAQKMGKTQPTIANKLRLLDLDEEVQKALLEGRISERHARSLLNIPDKNEQKNFLEKIINNRMTVRDTDLEIKKLYNSNGDNEELEIIGEDEEQNPTGGEQPTPSINNISNINNNIEQIKKQAVDINVPEPVANVNSLLQSENKPTQIETPPVEEEPHNRFIPEMEEEAPQQTTIENNDLKPIGIPPEPQPVIQPEPVAPTTPIEPATPEPITPVVPEPAINPEPITQPESVSEPQPAVQPEPTGSTDNIPETNNYSPPTNTYTSADLRTVINTVRECIETIEKYGFNVDSEEFDFEKMYQVIIKIDKK